MPNRILDQSILIHAPAAKVWRVFVDPTLTRQMGGEYVCDWKPGASFGWRNLEGQRLTDGTLLKIEPERLLQHTLHTPGAAGPDGGPAIVSVITYRLSEENGATTLSAQEKFSARLDDGTYADALEGWQAALQAVKAIAEQ